MQKQIRPEQVGKLGTILSVWAHPDDETFFAGAVMAAARQNGQRVVCVSATRGEAGVSEQYPTNVITAIREKEMANAMAALGVTEQIWLDYYDGGCAQVPVNEAVGKIQRLIKQIEPNSILTFGQGGFTGHPDHKAVAHWVMLAYRNWHTTSKLYQTTMTPTFAAAFGQMKRPMAYHALSSPDVTEESDLAIVFPLSDQLWAIKQKALACHASQMPGIEQAYGKDYMRQENLAEHFKLLETN